MTPTFICSVKSFVKASLKIVVAFKTTCGFLLKSNKFCTVWKTFKWRPLNFGSIICNSDDNLYPTIYNDITVWCQVVNIHVGPTMCHAILSWQFFWFFQFISCYSVELIDIHWWWNSVWHWDRCNKWKYLYQLVVTLGRVTD